MVFFFDYYSIIDYNNQKKIFNIKENIMENLKRRIDLLGGTYNKDCTSISELLQSLSFDKSVLLNLSELELFVDAFVDEFYDEFLEMDTIPSYDTIETRARMEVWSKKFTPLTEGTDDYKEWNNDIDGDSIKEYFGEEGLGFLIIGQAGGFPDHFFVKLNDESADPMVYGTDHEGWFQEIEEVCTVSEFFNSILTEEEYLVEMEKLKKELEEDMGDI